MTLEELRTDIQSAAEGNVITYDSRLTESDYIDYLIHQYRSKEVVDNYQRNGDIHSTWVQPFVVNKISKVDKAESNVMDLDKDFAKIDLPVLIQFKKRNNSSTNPAIRHVLDVRTNSRYYETSYEKYLLTRKSQLEGSRNLFFFMYGNYMYLSNVPEKLAISAIFHNPLKAYIFDNIKKDYYQLIIGNTYVVKNGSIKHSGITYNAPSEFIAVSEDFSGNGSVYSKNPFRLLTDKDEYPYSDSMCEILKTKIWQREFKLIDNGNKDKIGNADDEVNPQRQQADLQVPRQE